MPYLSASAVVFHKEVVYHRYVHLLGILTRHSAPST